jgi:uncharacterized protein YidB (DUF937 family)
MSFSVGGVAQPQQGLAQMDGRQRTSPMAQVMSGAASLLGVSDAELRGALASGSTLKELAEAKGVSQEDLKTAITQGLEQVGPPPGAEAVDPSAIAQGMPPPGAGEGEMAARFSTITSALGLDADQLTAALASGSSLSDIAGTRGMWSSVLKSLLTGPVAVDTAA